MYKRQLQQILLNPSTLCCCCCCCCRCCWRLYVYQFLRRGVGYVTFSGKDHITTKSEMHVALPFIGVILWCFLVWFSWRWTAAVVMVINYTLQNIAYLQAILVTVLYTLDYKTLWALSTSSQSKENKGFICLTWSCLQPRGREPTGWEWNRKLYSVTE